MRAVREEYLDELKLCITKAEERATAADTDPDSDFLPIHCWDGRLLVAAGRAVQLTTTAAVVSTGRE